MILRTIVLNYAVLNSVPKNEINKVIIKVWQIV